jgi:hypothetical protein
MMCMVLKDIFTDVFASLQLDPITIVVILDEEANAVGDLYVDDGRSYAFQRGEFMHRVFQVWCRPDAAQVGNLCQDVESCGGVLSETAPVVVAMHCSEHANAVALALRTAFVCWPHVWRMAHCAIIC